MPGPRKAAAPPVKRAAAAATAKGEDSGQPPAQERRVGGLLVLRVEPELSHMARKDGSKAPFKEREILHLEDGSTVFGCTQCFLTDPARGPIIKHYREIHRSQPAGRDAAEAPTRERKKAGDPLDGIATMTIGYVLSLAQSAQQLEATHERITKERDDAINELTDLRAQHRKLLKALEKVGFVPKLED